MLSSLPQTATGNPSLPEETRIYNSVIQAVFVIFMLCLWFSVGVMLFINKLKIPGVILILITLVGIVALVKILLDRSPQLIISTKGITTAKNGFHPWVDILDEGVSSTGEGKYKKYNLTYSLSVGRVIVDIGWLKIKRKTLQQLLIYYRKKHSSLPIL